MEGSGQCAGGWKEGSNKVLIGKSGWVEEGKLCYTIGYNLPVYDGDLVSKGGSTKLVTRRPEKLSVFPELVSMSSWIGKEIKGIRSIAGSNFNFPPGTRESDVDSVFMVDFTDGTIGEFIGEARAFCSSFDCDTALDINILIEIGMLTAVEKAGRDVELEFFDDLKKEKVMLEEERANLQKSLLNANWINQKKTYKKIGSIESRLEKIEDARAEDHKWYCKVFDFTYICNFVSGLVDLFDLKNRQHLFGRKVDDMVRPEGKRVSEIHKLFDATRRKENRSLDVYTVQFSDGSFSLPFGLCSGISMVLPLKSLIEIDLISEEMGKKAEANLGRIDQSLLDKETDQARLRELRKELNKFGIGGKRTIRVLKEIELLESFKSS